jgi:ketosteroid isomerase-like protein
MVDDDTVARLARHWEEGWNGHDLELLMQPFAPDVVFSSPYVRKHYGDPSRTSVEGVDDLRAYVAAALDRSGDVRYTLGQCHAGADSVILVYTCHLPDGVDKAGADYMRVREDGAVVEWHSHYTSDPTAWRG